MHSCFHKLSSRMNLGLCPTQSLYSGFLSYPPGEYFHSGLRRHVPRDQPGPHLRLRLHLLRRHPQRHAHLHPLQQVLRLLHQAQVPRVHCRHQSPREGAVCQEGGKEVGRVLRGRRSAEDIPPAVSRSDCQFVEHWVWN